MSRKLGCRFCHEPLYRDGNGDLYHSATHPHDHYPELLLRVPSEAELIEKAKVAVEVIKVALHDSYSTDRRLSICAEKAMDFLLFEVFCDAEDEEPQDE